jgi:hypothetical protein
MDAMVPLVLSALAVFGIVAALAGVESRDGFDRDSVDTEARLESFHPANIRTH